MAILRVASFPTAYKLADFANAAKKVTVASVVVGGNNYSLDDLLTVIGGDGNAAVLKVTGVTLGVINTVSIVNEGAYVTVPTNPVSTSGPGTGATFNLTTASLIAGIGSIQEIWSRSQQWYLHYWT